MSARILVIEDNPTNLELMVYLLSAFGHTPLTAQDGETGLALVEREKPDLIICDIDIPKQNGYEVARTLKTHPTFSAIPLIAVTAFAMVGDKEKMMAAGFDGYISKPIEPETFVSQAETFLPGRPVSRPATHTISSVQSSPQNSSKDVTILAVDNLPANILLLESILVPHGYSVVAASSAAEALILARWEALDLIVSDVHMPGDDGYALIRAVKSDPSLYHIPSIFLSSTTWSEQDIQYGLSLGAKRFLFRPIEPQEFLAEIEACLARND